LEAEELAEGDQSEDEDGSGGSAAPEEDILEEKKLGGGKPLPGLANLSFMPAGSLLGGSSEKEKKKKAEKEKEKKQKEKEKEVEKDIYRTPADDLATINLMVDAMEVLRILTQSLSPSSLEMLRWEVEQTPDDDQVVDDRVSVLEFMETEVVFAEFLRFFFLLAELSTRRDSKFCRGLTMQTRLDTYLRGMLLTHLQSGTRYMPPEAPASAPPAGKPEPNIKLPKAEDQVDEADQEEEQVDEAAKAEKPEEEEKVEESLPVVDEAQGEIKCWRGYDFGNPRVECLRAPRRWPAGYEQDVAGWN